MLEEDKDDLLGWPSVVEPNGPVEDLMDRGIGDESMQVAEVEQELQGFEDGEENWEVRVVGDDDVAWVILEYFDEAMLSVEETEAMETQGLSDEEESKLVRDGDVPELKDTPALIERLPAVDEWLPTAIKWAAIEDAFQNVPAAAEVVLESDEDELAAGEEMLASYDTLAVDDNVPAWCNEFPGPTAIEHLPTAIEDKLAAAKEILASNDVFAMDDDIPAECNELPEGEAMLVSYKNTPASKRVVLDNLSVVGGLWSLQDGCAVLLASVFRPACKVFAYRKVRRKKSHRKTTTHRHTRSFHHLLECPLSALARFRSICPLQVLYDLQLPSTNPHSVQLFQVRIWEVVELAFVWDSDGSGIGCFCANYWSPVEDVLWSYVKPPVSTGICKQATFPVWDKIAFMNGSLMVQGSLKAKTAIFFVWDGIELMTKKADEQSKEYAPTKHPSSHTTFSSLQQSHMNDQSILQATGGIRNENRQENIMESLPMPHRSYASRNTRELPDFDNVAIYQNKISTMISQVKTNPAQITYQFSIVTRQGIIASTQHLGQLDNDGDLMTVQRQWQWLSTLRTKITTPQEE